MRLALAQLDSRLGDVPANAEQARQALRAARRAGADAVVFPELYLSGYALGSVAGDASCSVRELAELAGEFDGGVLLGFRERDRLRTFDSAAYFEGGLLRHVHRKLYLVRYRPFDEDALFAPGEELRAFDTAAGRMAVLICNDAWQPFLPFVACQDGATILLVPSASSTVVPEAEAYWRELTRFQARMLQCYVVFVNRVGREGAFSFWGGSHIVNPRGEVVAEAGRFEEELLVADVDPAEVERRRAELRVVDDPRLDLLRAEIERLEESPHSIRASTTRR